MERTTLWMTLALAACGNGVVTLSGTTGGGSAGLISFGDTAPTGSGSGVNPVALALSGQVFYGLEQQPLPGATVTLDPPAAQAATADANGYFSFPALAPQSYVITASFPGLAPASQTVMLGSVPASVTLDLEASVPLFAPDGGEDIPWLAFAPDGGPLYASTATALWQLEGGGAAALWNDGSAVEPLGFGAGGDLVYLSDCDGGVPTGCRLAFGSAPAGVDGGVIDLFPDGGPFLVGDSVVFASEAPAANGAQEWDAVTATGLTPLGQFFAEPGPGLAPDHSAVAFLSLDGAIVTYSAAGLTPIAPLGEAIPYACDGSAFVPLSAGAVVALSGLSHSGAVLTPQSPTPSVTFSQGTRLAPGAPGSAIVSFVGDGQQWVYEVDAEGTTEATWVMVPTTAWPPVPSPDGRRAAFAGSPYVADFEAGACETLAETPAILAFSPDGASLLLVDGEGNLHAISLGSGGATDRLLEGTFVTAAAFAPDGRSVVYAGGDALANAGVFREPAAPPALPAAPAGP